MNCYLSALAGLGLLGGSFATLSSSEEQNNILRNVLSDDLAARYELIIKERRNHYIIGVVLGIVLSLLFVPPFRSIKTFTRITLFLVITLATACIFYRVMPKSDYMLNHLKTPEQTKKWLQVYNTMKTKYQTGFALGLLAAVPISRIVC